MKTKIQKYYVTEDDKLFVVNMHFMGNDELNRDPRSQAIGQKYKLSDGGEVDNWFMYAISNGEEVFDLNVEDGQRLLEVKTAKPKKGISELDKPTFEKKLTDVYAKLNEPTKAISKK